MRFGALPVGTDMKVLIAPLLQCMVDKSVPIRELADQVMTIIVVKRGASKGAIKKETDSLSTSFKRAVDERLQQIFDTATE